ICRALTSGHNAWFGTAQLAELRERLSQSKRDGDNAAGVESRRSLAQHLLRLGRADESIAVLTEALELAGGQTDGADSAAAVRFDLAVAHLRQAETQNCGELHCRSSCICPLDAAAVHQRPDASRAAAGHLSEFLQAGPHDPSTQYTAIWLLNLAYMTLGEWPQAVPEPFRLNPKLFASTADVGRFEDVAASLGVDTFNLAGGAAMDDFDGDGLLDIITSTSDPCRSLTYYHNAGDGSFPDRTQAAGLADQLGGLNINHADYDNDGRLDLLVLRGGWLAHDGRQRLSLLRNNGGGSFTDVTAAAGLAEPARPTQSAAWGDFDLDGDLDLYVAGETGGPPQSFGYSADPAAFPCALFRNNGDGTFTDIAPAAGVTNDRYAKSVVWGDYNDDNRPDLFVSNLGAPNRLYRNNGDGTFTDLAADAGVTQPIYSFPSWFFDYDNDGRLDLFIAAYEGDVGMLCAEYFGFGDRVKSARMKLYHNRGDGRFDDVTKPAGLHRLAFAMGANFGDIDNDGWLDFYLGTGYPPYEALMPNLMFRNDRGRRFLDVTTSGGFGHLQKGHGVAFGDLDNDGDQDLYHQLGGFFPGDAYFNALFLNPGHGNHWITIRLIGTRSNRFGVGARITLTIKDAGETRRIHRCVGTGGSFGSSSLQQEIGLAGAQHIETLEVTWPASGTQQQFKNVAADQIIEITEAINAYRRVPLNRVHLDPAPPRVGQRSSLP
ncbi:MAG: FG-GAP-like repeat-containing protein, partial [Phycisphaerae bacterium]